MPLPTGAYIQGKFYPLGTELPTTNEKKTQHTIEAAFKIGAAVQKSVDQIASTSNAEYVSGLKRKHAIIDSKSDNTNKKSKPEYTECYGCGSTEHKFNNPDCPAKTYTCSFCKHIGHYETVCKSSDADIIDRLIAREDNMTNNNIPFETMLDAPLDLIEDIPQIESPVTDPSNSERPTPTPKPISTLPTGSFVITDSDDDNLWTFIYRGPPPVFNNYKGSVISINHIDHYHFVFQGSQKNRRRTIERIFHGGNMPRSSLPDAIKTCIPVIKWSKFCAYLARRGAQIENHGKQLEKYYIDLLNVEPSDMDCADLNRELRKNNKPTQIMRKQRTDLILDMVRLNDTRQMDAFENSLSTQQRLDLYNDFGNQWQEVAKLCIKIYNEELVRAQIDTPYEQYEGSHDECEYPTNFEASDAWFDMLMEKNDIDKKVFCASVSTIMNKKVKRVNTLCLEGPTTTGKSLLLKLICGEYNYGTVQRSGDHSQFFLQNLLKKTVALMEEPRITPITVQDFKLLLGGEPLDIHVKHQDDCRLPRIPVLISTNHELGFYTSSLDKDALYNRTHYYKFKCQLGSHIPLPPSTLCCCHFKHWYGKTCTLGSG